MTITKGTQDLSTLSLPRIVCLHGGGVNAQVFELQSRVIIHHLRARFRLVFVDAPYITTAHPDIVTVYGDLGPFRHWLRWLPDQPATEDGRQAALDIQRVVRAAMDADQGSGDWVGVLGFSQGAKIAASLLWAQEMMGPERAFTSFKFGVIMAGRGPLVELDLRVPVTPYVFDASLITDPEDLPKTLVPESLHVLRIPTVHVHGLEDPGLDLHRLFLDRYFIPDTTRLVEWQGAHRLPIKSADVSAIVEAILGAAKDGGVL